MKLCSPEAQAAAPGHFTPVKRPETLQGMRVGFLDNTKPPADKIMRHLDQRLQERFPGLQGRHYSKTAASTPMTDDMARRLKEECDVVITGFGD